MTTRVALGSVIVACPLIVLLLNGKVCGQSRKFHVHGQGQGGTGGQNSFIPVGPNGGGIAIGPNSIGIKLPDQMDDGEIIKPGPQINFPVHPHQQGHACPRGYGSSGGHPSASLPPRPPRPQFVPVYPQPSPQYIPVPSNTTTLPLIAPRKNERPHPIVTPQRNQDPSQRICMATARQIGVAQQITEEAALEHIDSLRKLLPSDPAVETALDELEKKIKDGKEITDADKAVLIAAIQPTLQSIPATSLEEITDAIIGAQTLSGINETLIGLSPQTGIPVLPLDVTPVLLVPGWPPDELVMMSNGLLAVGTGGTGSVSVVPANPSELMGIPVGSGEPLPGSTDTLTKLISSGTVLLNPAQNGAEVNYVLSSRWDYGLKPGGQHCLPERTGWSIRFDRGVGNREAKYSLKNGSYEFVAGDSGWDLRPITFKLTLDNSGNDQVFNYVIDNKQSSLGPGATVHHTSQYPILIVFDPGDGGTATEKRVAAADNNLVVAINPRDGLWDLYPADNFSVPTDIVAQNAIHSGRTSRRASPVRRVADPGRAQQADRTKRFLAQLQSVEP